jgi:hypothetical protein
MYNKDNNTIVIFTKKDINVNAVVEFDNPNGVSYWYCASTGIVQLN